MLVCSKGNFSSQERLKSTVVNKTQVQEYFITRCPACHAEYNTAASMLEHLASHCSPQENVPCWLNGIPPGTTPGMFVSPPDAAPDRNATVFVPIALPVCNLSEMLCPASSDRETSNERMSKSEEASDISSDSDRMDIDESRCSSPEEGRMAANDSDSVAQEPIDLSKDSSGSKAKGEEEPEMYELDPLNLCMVTMENERLEMINKMEEEVTNRESSVEVVEQESKPKGGLEIIEAVGLVPVESPPKPKTPNVALSNPAPKKTVGGRRKHECFYCRKEFSGSTALKRHILLHTGEKPFKCSFCNCAYTRKFMLEKHVKVWHDESTEELMEKGLCPYCKKEFKNVDQLKTHMTHHVNEGSHRCKLCNMAFRYHAMLREHMTKVHLCPDMTEAPPKLSPPTKVPEKPENANQPESPPESPAEKSVKTIERKFCCELCGAAFHRKQHLQKHEETTVHIVSNRNAGTEAKVVVTPKREEHPIKPPATSPPPAVRSHNPILQVPVFTDVKPNKKEFECETCGAEFQYRAQYVFHLLNHEK